MNNNIVKIDSPKTKMAEQAFSLEDMGSEGFIVNFFIVNNFDNWILENLESFPKISRKRNFYEAKLEYLDVNGHDIGFGDTPKKAYKIASKFSKDFELIDMAISLEENITAEDYNYNKVASGVIWDENSTISLGYDLAKEWWKTRGIISKNVSSAIEMLSRELTDIAVKDYIKKEDISLLYIRKENDFQNHKVDWKISTTPTLKENRNQKLLLPYQAPVRHPGGGYNLAQLYSYYNYDTLLFDENVLNSMSDTISGLPHRVFSLKKRRKPQGISSKKEFEVIELLKCQVVKKEAVNKGVLTDIERRLNNNEITKMGALSLCSFFEEKKNLTNPLSEEANLKLKKVANSKNKIIIG